LLITGSPTFFFLYDKEFAILVNFFSSWDNSPHEYFRHKIDLNLSEKIRGDLIDQGFELSKPPYTVFAAKKKGLSCTLYLSGKLMVQGKEKDEFITFYLEPEILKDLSTAIPRR
jgi:ribonuclease HIII